MNLFNKGDPMSSNVFSTSHTNTKQFTTSNSSIKQLRVMPPLTDRHGALTLDASFRLSSDLTLISRGYAATTREVGDQATTATSNLYQSIFNTCIKYR